MVAATPAVQRYVSAVLLLLRANGGYLDASAPVFFIFPPGCCPLPGVRIIVLLVVLSVGPVPAAGPAKLFRWPRGGLLAVSERRCLGDVLRDKI